MRRRAPTAAAMPLTPCTQRPASLCPRRPTTSPAPSSPSCTGVHAVGPGAAGERASWVQGSDLAARTHLLPPWPQHRSCSCRRVRRQPAPPPATSFPCLGSCSVLIMLPAGCRPPRSDWKGIAVATTVIGAFLLVDYHALLQVRRSPRGRGSGRLGGSGRPLHLIASACWRGGGGGSRQPCMHAACTTVPGWTPAGRIHPTPSWWRHPGIKGCPLCPAPRRSA